jgi:hypothetical protein
MNDMRIIFLTLLFGLTIMKMVGQNAVPFPMTNVNWTMDKITVSMSNPPETSHMYSYYKTNGDTILNGKTYTKIFKETGLYCFLREEDALVYCKYNDGPWIDTTEFILYDFSLNVGDTVQLPLLDFSLNYYPGVVEYVDSIMIGSTKRKIITVSSWITFDFVEGVGSLQGLLYPEIPWVDWGGELTCFSINDTIFRTDGSGNINIGNCWQTINVNDLKINNLLVFPNPFNDCIEITGIEMKRVMVYSLTGKLIYESSERNNDLDFLKKGTYILRIIDRNDSQIDMKLIKE